MDSSENEVSPSFPHSQEGGGLPSTIAPRDQVTQHLEEGTAEEKQRERAQPDQADSYRTTKGTAGSFQPGPLCAPNQAGGHSERPN